MRIAKQVPQHVAIIMDGNGRWAKKRNLPKIAGHREGIASIEKVMKAADSLGVKILTLYTFSTENWKRPKAEVEALFGLMEEYIDRESEKLKRDGVRLSVIGRVDALPARVREKILRLVSDTASNTGLVLNLALNYGGRAEILDACRSAVKDVSAGLLKPEDINEEIFSGYLYTKGLPDPDLMIRTSGEMRISNFLLWQLSYAEFYITQVLWPDFDESEFKKAIDDYLNRERRYGG
ncbi:MAG: isoprenyl transferase [Candidatus Omnitrophica bacterium]|nr:isoprenyl transferase [Candidatus Omnitrophota bacterium]